MTLKIINVKPTLYGNYDKYRMRIVDEKVINTRVNKTIGL